MSVEESVQKIKAAIAQSKTRLARGQARRETMRKELDQGIINDTPRYRWLRESAGVVIDDLIDAAKKFNDANPDDLISSQDLLDVLETTKRNLENASHPAPKKQRAD